VAAEVAAAVAAEAAAGEAAEAAAGEVAEVAPAAEVTSRAAEVAARELGGSMVNAKHLALSPTPFTTDAKRSR
jgi:hypothetical protein